MGTSDHAVNVAVGKLRTALGDSAEKPFFIETVPRRGYRFVAAVESPPALAAPAELRHCRLRIPVIRKSRKQIRRQTPAVGISGRLRFAALLCGGRMARAPQRQVEPPEIQRLTVNHGTVYSARFAPDGRNVLYAASWKGAD